VNRPSFAALRRSMHAGLLMAGAALGIVAGAGFLFLHEPDRGADPTPVAQSAVPAPAQAVPAVPPPVMPPPAAFPAADTSDVIVGRNDTLDAIFKRLSLDPADLAAIRQMPGMRQNLDFLKPGDVIRLKHDGATVKELSRKISEVQTVHIVRKDAGFEASTSDDPVEMRTRTASATIDSSLFQAAESARISDIVALKLANIFGWDIDFVLDIREGDRFTAVYQQVYQDGKYLRDGDVLAAEFVNNGRVYRAVRFVNDAGAVGYYSPDGKPMRKAFLRAPVEFTRVSSVFNPHRMHPILNLIRGHMGTDYAAPTGTPVMAAGDGHVTFAGRRGGYGNAIVLSHGSEISTLYGHMSRFGRNIRVGSQVQQGQVIGYVGMTGLATGPHLHYEYLVNGVHKDPQSVKLPGAEPLRAEILVRFHSDTAALLADLSPQPAQPAPAAVSQAAAAASPQPGAARAEPPTPSAKTPNLSAGVSPYHGESHSSVN
jgi:murein DD-endopeptidase MepM/ murein hydrolase activator NlpD